MTKNKATVDAVASRYSGKVFDLTAILRSRNLQRKSCCRVPVSFPCECAEFHAMRERVRAVRRSLAGGGR